MSDRESVELLLGQSPFLLPLLDEALPVLRSHLGGALTPELRASGDELHVLVPVAVDDEVAWSRLERFDEAWWLDALPRARGQMLVTLRRR